jgi:putative FmdB family regulatory protein
MPIFEYLCKDCQKRFEAILYGKQQPQCPQCHGTNLDQQISKFAVGASHAPAAASPCASAGCCEMAANGGCPKFH